MFIKNSKIRFESKSQHATVSPTRPIGCLSRIQRYVLKANHNSRWITFSESTDVYQEFKDTFWKQITTSNVTASSSGSMFIKNSKIRFESKSQPVLNTNRFNNDVYQEFKDTFWKQITTSLQSSIYHPEMFIKNSKIRFESKSQLLGMRNTMLAWCLSRIQRYVLKANHNT